MDKKDYTIRTGEISFDSGGNTACIGHWVELKIEDGGQRYIGAGTTQREALECAQAKLNEAEGNTGRPPNYPIPRAVRRPVNKKRDDERRVITGAESFERRVRVDDENNNDKETEEEKMKKQNSVPCGAPSSSRRKVQRALFVWNKEALVTSDIFQRDLITVAVNELNDALDPIGKCARVQIKLSDDSDVELFDLGGYIITTTTLRRLISEGVVKIDASFSDTD